MTTAEVTPSQAPGVAYRQTRTEGDAEARYLSHDHVRYTVRLPRAAPPSLRMAIQFGAEPEGIWAHIEELDVSAEGDTAREAFGNVVLAARTWLIYVRDEEPDLADGLVGQRQYVELLDTPVFSWFRKFSFADA